MCAARWGVSIAGIVVATVAAIAMADRPKKPAASPTSTGIEALDQVDPQPTGKDIRIDDAEVGEGYWTLNIPQDYDATRKWPVIFNFHFKKGHPHGGPFDALTDHKGYIIVGLGYLDEGFHNNPDVQKTLAILKHVHTALARKLNIDDRLLFIGGVSQGGFRGSVYFESSPDAWAGVILLDAGREPNFSIMPNGNPNYARKPIYIGDGENDREVLPGAQKSVDFYKTHGADVTFEIYKNMGHVVDMKSQTLKQWLLDHGTLMHVKSEFAEAMSLEKSGKKGKAYTAFQQMASAPSAGDYADKAKAECDAIEASAGKESDAAAADISAGKMAVGLGKLAEISRVYAGSPFADKADARLAELRAAPPTTAPSAQADNTAKRHPIQQVTQAPKDSQSGAAMPAKAGGNQPDADCKRWMSLADSYIENGNADEGKVYLQKIIDQYPSSSWADSAKQKLQKLQ
jgi:predicted esterase